MGVLKRHNFIFLNGDLSEGLFSSTENFQINMPSYRSICLFCHLKNEKKIHKKENTTLYLLPRF